MLLLSTLCAAVVAQAQPNTAETLKQENVFLQEKVERLEQRVAATSQRTSRLELEEARENEAANMLRARAAQRLERLAAGQLTLESGIALTLAGDSSASFQLGALEAELGELATEANLDSAVLEARAAHEARRHVNLALQAWQRGLFSDTEALLAGATERLRAAEEYAAQMVAQRPVLPSAEQ